VPGTAGIGQPGNAAVVARRSGFGGPFAHLDQLQHGDRILVATTQGQSLYIVRQVKTETLVNGSPTTSSTLTGVSTGPKPTGTVSTTKLYGPTPGDQLTLVTSASSAPWNTDRAIVVTATMRGKPFAPTPQQSRSPSQDGNSGDPNALPVLALAVLALVATLIGAVALYRRASLRSAYLLTTAPLIVFTVLGAEAASRLLPAWM
jgi:sortase A